MGSIGWRMGYGEDYQLTFNDWYTALSNDEQTAYQNMFPTPATWRGYYNNDDTPARDEYFHKGIPFWEKHGKCRYSREWLVSLQEKGEALNYVFFWKPGKAQKDCLGQWQPSIFKECHMEYNCAEQYMMAKKAQIFEDKEMGKEIMETTNPKLMKALGKKVKNFDNCTWDKVKYSIVLNGNYHKFAQNKEMRGFLLSTGAKILVEASPLDRIWGIGLYESNEAATDPRNWRGQNLLGFALMEVRDELRRVYRNYHYQTLPQLPHKLLIQAPQFPIT